MSDIFDDGSVDDNARIEIDDRSSLHYWSERLGASKEELRCAVDQVGPKVKAVKAHLVGGFTGGGPTS
jgi:hypothetical protein